jgi:hypothetical protein
MSFDVLELILLVDRPFSLTFKSILIVRFDSSFLVGPKSSCARLMFCSTRSINLRGVTAHRYLKDPPEKIPTRVVKKEINLKKAKRVPLREKSSAINSTSNGNSVINFDTNRKKTSSEQIALFSPELEGFHEQMDIIDLIEETPDSLYSYLTSKNYEVIDKRPKGGSLWIVGGAEHKPLINELKQKGISFQFTDKGSRATKHRPGWFTNYNG